MYLKNTNILRTMNAAEFTLAILTLVIGGNGFLFVLMKKWWEKKMKELEYQHVSEADKREHEQQLQIEKLRLEKESLSDTLQKFAEGNTFLNKVVTDYKCSWAGLIKISNGEKFIDGEHIWKYSVTQQSDVGVQFKFIHDLHKKPLEETGTLFSTLQRQGYVFVNISQEHNLTTFSQRLQQRGIIAYCLVSTVDVMNAMLVCWSNETASGVDISPETLQIIMGDFRGKEGYLI